MYHMCVYVCPVRDFSCVLGLRILRHSRQFVGGEGGVMAGSFKVTISFSSHARLSYVTKWFLLISGESSHITNLVASW